MPITSEESRTTNCNFRLTASDAADLELIASQFPRFTNRTHVLRALIHAEAARIRSERAESSKAD